MNRYVKIGLFAVFVFGLGTFSGRLIDNAPHPQAAQSARLDSLKTSTPETQTSAAETPVPIPAGDFFTALPGESAKLPSFEDIMAEAPDVTIQTVSASVEVSAEQIESTRAAIRNQFPELDDVTVDAWAETYADLPASELAMLLEQRRLIPRITPTLTQGEQTRTPGVFKTSSLTECLMTNLQNVRTCGYRRIAPVTVVTSATNSAVRCEPQRFFGQGEIVPSSDSLHLALDSPVRWFVLQPGNILTRCGQFERTESGGVGVTLDGIERTLAGDIEIPAEADAIKVSTDGTISASLDGKPIQCGQITIAIAENERTLKTSNGVYFTQGDTHWRPAEKVSCVISGALELSNVDVAEDARLLESLRIGAGE